MRAQTCSLQLLSAGLGPSRSRAAGRICEYQTVEHVALPDGDLRDLANISFVVPTSIYVASGHPFIYTTSLDTSLKANIPGLK
jgi:hypothetical protein